MQLSSTTESKDKVDGLTGHELVVLHCLVVGPVRQLHTESDPVGGFSLRRQYA